MTKIYRVAFAAFLLFSFSVFAQNYKVSGKVTDEATGEALVGANVYIQNNAIGAATDVNGNYSITLPAGDYTVICSYVGYEKLEKKIEVNEDMTQNFSLKDYQFTLNVTVISERAKERETPVAFTNISKRDMETMLGSRDIPLILSTTPSVYATDNGGGAGDARINVRGFNQRNVAIMVNGVPINDMENGWVYWSNWDGLGDATSSIQLQRGLTAINLATPSIGGTMNIITDPTQYEAGVLYKNELGSGEFNKQSLFLNSGLIDEKFALSIGGVRKTGAGVVDRAWTDAWAYYFGASYQINQKNRIEVYGIGAPQRHGQRTYRLNLATFSHDLAREVGYSEETLSDPRLREQGLLYNSNWNSVSSSYQEHQYWNDERDLRYDETFIMERENYYHKPVINFNWYTQLSDAFSVYTTLYYSGGVGGGSGTFGSLVYDYSLLQRVPDWDATIARNIANVDTVPGLNGGNPVSLSRGILRNSTNNQWTIGAIAKSYLKVSENFTASFGLDWRTAEIDHFRHVRDLLGGDYFYFDGNEFESGLDYYKGLGDKVDYNFTNTVNWYGAYLQGEYTSPQWTFYGMAGASIVKYDHTNHFRMGAGGSELMVESDNITGFQTKGGISYRATDLLDFYINGGYISKVPILDAVINDNTSELIDNPENENFISFEFGTNFNLINRIWTISGNFYYTLWNNRTVNKTDFRLDGNEGIVTVTGLDASHMGFEVSTALQPVKYVRFDGALSIGNWEQKNDPLATYKNYSSSSGIQDSSFTIYLDGLKVGDAPQTQFAAALSLFPIRDLQLQIVWKHFASYFADWDPLTRTDPTDREQSWETPSYSLFDLHFNYKVPVKLAGVDVSIFAHVFNLFDEVYVQDATDNSSFNAYKDNGLNHSADDAEVFLGLPRTYNLGFSVEL